MRYICLVHHEESWFSQQTPETMKQLDRDSLLYDEQLAARGQLVVAEALKGANTARLVRVRQKKATVIDGPFAETKEQLIGFLLIEARDIDEAVEIAKGVPLARTGTIEVREAFFVDA